MIIILGEIKQQIYDILSVDLNYNVMDNPYDIPVEDRSFPYVMLRLSNTTRDVFKNCFQYVIKYKIDIFSDYDGEQEILDMEEAIFNNISKLYNNDKITYVRESQFTITDDKSTGVTRKHGIITYTIMCQGGFITDIVEGGEDAETGSSTK